MIRAAATRLEKNPPERAASRFGLPLTHLVSHYALEEAQLP